MDFTLSAYKNLLQSLLSESYKFHTFQQFLQKNQPAQTVALRHDIDNRPNNALAKAKLEHVLGIHSTYFFRIIHETFKPEIIRQIAELGHEIGYHYEDLSLTNGDIDKVYESFKENLAAFRAILPRQNHLHVQ